MLPGTTASFLYIPIQSHCWLVQGAICDRKKKPAQIKMNIKVVVFFLFFLFIFPFFFYFFNFFFKIGLNTSQKSVIISSILVYLHIGKKLRIFTLKDLKESSVYLTTPKKLVFSSYCFWRMRKYLICICNLSDWATWKFDISDFIITWLRDQIYV